MKKHTIVAAMLGLAAAGCAHTRKAGPDAPANPPVGMSPIPSIHETINRGFNDPSISKRTLPDPTNPGWDARYQTKGGPGGAAAPAAATAGRSPGAATPPAQPPAEIPALAPEVVTRESAPAPREPAGDPAVSPSSTAPAPDALAPAAAPVGEVIDVAPLPPIGDSLDAPAPGEPPAAEPGIAPAAPPANEPAVGASPAVPGQPDASPPDPLLGPNPELMPPGLQGLASPEVQDPGPGNPSGAPLKPDATPAPPAASTEASALSPAPAPIGGGSAELAPAPESGPAAAPELSPAPDPTPAPAPAPAPATGPTGSAGPTSPGPQTLAARTPAPRVDAQVVQASTADSGERAEDVIGPNWKRAGETAARVGDEVITVRELVVGVKDHLRKYNVPSSQVSREEKNMLAQNVLANLIDRSLIYQESRRQLKDKQMSQLLEVADKAWAEEDLPQLLRQYAVENEHQLKLKLEESGRSIAALKQSYRQDFIAMIFIQQKLKDKMHVELPEMLKYYNAHMNDKSNYRAARIDWREILVEASRHADRAEARRKAEGLLARLQAGEDFSKLARAESEGPTAVKNAGGLMETSPGGYGVVEVNRAIETLPLNTISGIIEGPSSFHIVKVERRRPAGPASFAEVQDQIRREIFAQKAERERRALLDRLRANTIVTSIFDGTESDPRTVRRN